MALRLCHLTAENNPSSHKYHMAAKFSYRTQTILTRFQLPPENDCALHIRRKIEHKRSTACVILHIQYSHTSYIFALFFYSLLSYIKS
ncbi:hypothetical protein BYT27DRAFT_7192031 [Phlegmacium glaucopus]|nr:hypothetical protein BYT27DRAFT_7192031 [Phlegmacium glaucopus]